MQISVYLGPRQTDLSHVAACLGQNRDRLATRRIAMTDPTRAHALIGEALREFEANGDLDGSRNELLEGLLDGTEADRIVICDENALGPAFGSDGLFPMAPVIMTALSQVFDGHDLTFHLSTRNPATFLPALFDEGKSTFAEFMDGNAAETVLWSDLLKRLSAAGDRPIKVWRSEDSPLIWPGIIYDIAGCAARLALDGLYDFPNSLMTPDGVAALQKDLAEHKLRFAAQKQVTIRKYLAKYARDDATEQEIDLPGWDTAFVDQLTAKYNADMATIADIENVVFLRPEAL